MNISERTKIRNHPELAVPEETSAILAQGLVAHVGFVQDEQPFVIPMSYHYDPQQPEHLYLHGSVRSRTLKHLASGAPVCVTVTLTDGLVYSRKAMNHSMNYRSVVLFGNSREVTQESQKAALFDQMVQRYFPGRTLDQDYHMPSPQDLGATALLEVTLQDVNAKARRGPPTGPEDDDPQAMGSAGVQDLREF